MSRHLQQLSMRRVRGLSCDPSKMAARILLRRCRGSVLSPSCASPRYSSRFPGPGPPSWKDRFTQFLGRYFHGLQDLSVRVKNGPYTRTRYQFGNDMAAAIFALKLNGKIKLRGREEWFSGRVWRLDPELCLEGVDVSGSVINYNGLTNLVVLDSLRYLNLSQCPFIDDWCLNQLYNLAGSLEELSLAGCYQVTEKGLACLHHLENLRHLDVSDLPNVEEEGLVRILLEEMLPQCDIVGMKKGAWGELDLEPSVQTVSGMEDQTASGR